MSWLKLVEDCLPVVLTVFGPVASYLAGRHGAWERQNAKDAAQDARLARLEGRCSVQHGPLAPILRGNGSGSEVLK